jgi:sugar lactone lactonase YvrE
MRRFNLLLGVLAIALPATAQQGQDIISTFMGGGPGFMPATYADLNAPQGVVADAAGNFYVADFNANRVFKVDTTGTLTVFAGLGIQGYSGDGVPGGATQATFNGPLGLSLDAAGNVYIADYNNCVVRKVNAAGTITTVAGVAGSCSYNGEGSPATTFNLNHPVGVAADNLGNLYIGDAFNCRVRKLVLSSSTISTYAGTGTCSFGGDGGAATSAAMNRPTAVASDTAGNIYVADYYNYRIRKVVRSTGVISTIGGSGTYGFSGDGGLATSANISYVWQLSVDGAGSTVTIADEYNHRVRRFTVGGNISTIAGTGTAGFCGDGGQATSACLYYPVGVFAAASGAVYVADTSNHRVRQFTVGGNINTVAGNGDTKFPTLVSGIAPLGVVLNYPYGVAGDAAGNVYVNDSNNYMVRELNHSQNLVNFFAGTGTHGYSGDGGPAVSANLNYNYGVAHDSAGNVYIADTSNHIIRKVDTSGIITTFAGTPQSCGFAGDGGVATAAKLCNPNGVAVGPDGAVYIADTSNQRIRKVAAGTITTIAGNGTAGYIGDGDPATAAELRNPNAIAIDGSNNVYIADTSNCRIREVTKSTGIITTVAGSGACNFTGDGLAILNGLNSPQGILADPNGNLFIADTNNQRLRWVDPWGQMTTFAGTGSASYNGDGTIATSADMYYPSGIYQDAGGNYLVADQYNLRIRAITAFSALSPSDQSLDMGLVSVGSRSTPQLLTLSALGPVSIFSIQTTGDFSESDNCGAGLNHGARCTVYVYFTPTASTNRTGKLTVNYNGLFNGTLVVSLSGTGSAISITGSPVSFGNQTVKTTSAPKTVTVKNNGSTAVTMGTITLNQTTDFAIASNGCPASGQPLAAGASCNISLTFTPQSTGLKRGSLLIYDSDPSSPQIVGMTGTGASGVALSPSSLTFGTQAVGTTSSALKLTLTNNTGASLTLGNPAVTVTGPFRSVSATSCTNSLLIVAGGTCNIYVVFAPTTTGYPTGTVSVSDSAPASPQTANLYGTATGVSFTPTTMNFGSSRVGVRVSSSLTITNVGPTRITFAAAAFYGADAADFTSGGTNPPCSGSLNPGASCTFSLYFTPSRVGAEAATYQVFDTSAGSPQILSLSGTGQ